MSGLLFAIEKRNYSVIFSWNGGEILLSFSLVGTVVYLKSNL